MYVKKILLKNIRGFAELEFDLERPGGGFAGWTVLTGGNGSGKSTLLKAVAVGLVGSDTARALEPSFRGWMREGVEGRKTSIRLDMVRVVEDDGLFGGGAAPSSRFPVELEFKVGGKQAIPLRAKPEGTLAKYGTPERTLWAPGAYGWFSCGYGPFRRMFGASPEAMRQMVSPVTERFVTMFQEAASLAEVDQWLRTLKHKELENRADETAQLKLMLAVLQDEFLPNGVTVERVDSDGLWLRDGSGASLTWSDMSDGFRSALALLADIVRHLINAYGLEGLYQWDEQGGIVFNRSGVVLIDEIDAHLHPAWQRRIGFWLKRRFPKIQFLVTSHSPIICQAADPNGLFFLPDAGERPRAATPEEYQRIISARPDTILLTPAFGLQNTRSPQAVEWRAEWARLNAKKRAGAPLTPEEANRREALSQYPFADEAS